MRTLPILLLALAILACRSREAGMRSRDHFSVIPPASASPPGERAGPVDASSLPPLASVATASPAPAATVTAALAPARVESIRVDKDAPASLVRPLAASAAPRTVFLPGVCSNAAAYLMGFPEAARTHGGVLAIDGDHPCAGAPGFRSFAWDANMQHARITAALRAAGVSKLPREGLTLVGYSAGAGIGEQMAQRWPRRYRRLVLIGAPSDPSTKRLAHAEAVVTMSCAQDVPGRMRSAAQRLRVAGVPSLYIEMPGCTHGNLGEPELRFAEAFEWLMANTRKAADSQDEEEL